MTFWQQVGIIIVGAAVSMILNGVMTVYLFRLKKSQEDPSRDLAKLREDHDKLEAAFVSHTGITINGKSYRMGG